MNVSDVPQEGNRTLGHHRKALYAKDTSGRMVLVASKGSEVDETVTLQAVERLHAFAEDARKRCLAGQTAPLEVWMWTQRMDLALLSQVTGIWQWRIRRHLRPSVFANLTPTQLQCYALALGLSVEQLQQLP
ncbi:hypothetical protein [Rhodoferax saidenbachensis]|uniref:Uncharacterized protein n=1 Tax=Rhodoferax saidenbachensis TaxID=1484693 RepID=A0ABU1ZKK6_9BURK|nr:hypothetical protein [Rhodoferax saidenbachensis]MDR7306082.1 hypothetical protein [Rhodoferax saidenbachensis]